MGERSGKEHEDSEALAGKLPVALSTSASPSARKAYWRSLEEYADAPAFREWAGREFPQLAEEMERSRAQGSTSRRRFLQLMGASLALAGLTGVTGCRREEGKIRPYNKKPAAVVLGKPLYYATTMVLAGVPMGLLVETHEGRPTKIEGNPLHPNSLGATNAFAQASVLDLYDPERSRAFLHDGQAVGRDAFLAFIEKTSKEWRAAGGKGLAILSEEYASPAVEMLREHIGKVMPHATWHVHEPLGSRAAPGADGGSAYRAIYDLGKADVILSLDCDLLGLEDQGVRYKRQFADRRRVQTPGDTINRLYVVEPHFTVTGAAADHRWAMGASSIEQYLVALEAALSGPHPNPLPKGEGIGDPHPNPLPEYRERGKSAEGETLAGVDATWVTAVAADLAANRGKCLVVAGRRQPARVHELVASINERLGNVEKTIGYVPVNPGQSLHDLCAAIGRDEVSTLVILGGNPAYDAPVDLDFALLLDAGKVSTTIRLGMYEDETSVRCTWHVPAAHYLESWGDARAADGTISAVQPMIDPLFGGISVLEFLARISGYTTSDAHEIVRRSFAQTSGMPTEEAWRAFLNEGVHRGTGVSPVSGISAMAGSLVAPTTQHGRDARATGESLSSSRMEICFAPSESVFDGRFANNGWLQECPDPMTKLTWDNAAVLSPKTARELKVETGDVVKIELGGRSIEAPVFVMPGHADWSVTLPLGYGRSKSGTLGTGTGVNAYALRTSDGMGFAVGATVRKTGKTYPLATTQEHHAVAEHHLSLADEQAGERAIIREGTMAQYSKDPAFAKAMGEHAPIRMNIYTSPKLEGPHQWGMVIDLNACIGCNACAVACQSENNIPIVGKDEVIRGREMQWLRLDRYFAGDPDGEVRASMQPMLCQHCENAPCEPVCPVNATVHSPEGLNEMVYNRCIGTRYCSNNCPYKVRRFNFFDYNKGTIRESGRAPFDGHLTPDPREGFSQPQVLQPPMQEMLKMQKNPDVTVRIRGVMEKCTYCVQRIQAAKIEAKAATGQSAAGAEVDGQPAVKVADGAVQTACAQACPTQAIVFGDTADPNSRVSQLRGSPRDYAVLEHLNTRPRTTYLARVRNPNPALMPPSLSGQEVHG